MTVTASYCQYLDLPLGNEPLGMLVGDYPD